MRIFEPWVGDNYYSIGLAGKKVLFLGEAHYGMASERASDFTQRIIKDYALEKGISFFTKVAKLGMGRYAWDQLSTEDRQEFWGQVAFYNYVQEFPSNRARVPPSEKMWLEAKDPFLKTLQELKPDLVVVLGKRLSEHLPDIPDQIDVCIVNHPSSNFSYKKWIPVLEQSLV